MVRLIRRLTNSLFLIIRSAWTRVEWGAHSSISAFATLDTTLGGHVKFGARCEVGKGAVLATYGGLIEIGDDCSVNPYCVLYGHGNLRIGCGVRIAAHCVIIPANHVIVRTDQYIYKQGLTMKGISIERDVWIGAGVKVLDGVTIAHGCVIAAGAVVTKSTDPLGVYAGVPARRIRDRSCDEADMKTRNEMANGFLE